MTSLPLEGQTPFYLHGITLRRQRAHAYLMKYDVMVTIILKGEIEKDTSNITCYNTSMNELP